VVAWAPDLPDLPPAEAGAREPAAGRPPATGTAAARRSLASCAAASPLQVLRGLDSSRRGLDETEAQLRLARLGDNAIVVGGRASWVTRTAAAVRNPFVVILICLTVVSAATGDLGGAAVITVMAVLSCLLRVTRECRSDRAAAGLRAMVAITATVVRRASPGSPAVARELPVDQLVPGDVVQLAAGDMVPADLRLLRTDDLVVSQAVFTGESEPAAKRAASVIAGGTGAGGHAGPGWAGGRAGARWAGGPAGPAGDDAPIFDAPGLCFMGTSVVSGSATAVVVATGMSTYLGSTHQELPRASAETAFDRGVRDVTWMLISLMLVCVPVVLAVNASIRGHLLEALLFAVAIAVGLTPEMLPVVVTSALASGAAVVARKAAIVKRLPAMHNLGAMDVLCTDKTGTLTEDRVSLDCHLDPAGRTDPGVLWWAWLNSYFSATAGDGAVTDVLDQALLVCGADRGLFAEDRVAMVDVIPFDFRRRRVTVVTRTVGVPGRHTLITKGAPAEVLDRCSRFRGNGRDLPLGPAEREAATALADGYARDGVRLLAVAVATRPARLGRYRPADEDGLTLVGLVGFRDVPRPSARQAVADLAAQGIAIKILTGDHPLVAARVCRDVGIDPGQVVTGETVARLDDGALVTVAAAGTVFARVDPAQKARLVRALRSAGQAVGFLGDGANDAAALREADVGISVHSATAVARECADVILLRKDLTMLGQAIQEGRRSFGNVIKYLKITISSNFGNVLSMLAASAVLPFLPMLPLQVLAQNLCFDVSQLSLAFDTVDEPSLRAPRTFDRRDLAGFIIWLGPVNALADLVTFAFLWWIMRGHVSAADQALFRTGWFTENLLSQAVAVHLLRSRWLPSRRRHAARPVLLATLALALVGLGLPLTPVGAALRLQPLPLMYYPLLAAVLAGYALAIVAARSWYLRLNSRWL
jgi:P-type Mg2+ transporter